MNLLRIEDVSALTGISVPSLRQYRFQGRGPKSFVLAGRVTYKLADVEAWVEAQYAQAVGGTA